MTLVFGMKIAFIYNHLIAKIKQPEWGLYFFGNCYMTTIFTGCLILIMWYFSGAAQCKVGLLVFFINFDIQI